MGFDLNYPLSGTLDGLDLNLPYDENVDTRDDLFQFAAYGENEEDDCFADHRHDGSAVEADACLDLQAACISHSSAYELPNDEGLHSGSPGDATFKDIKDFEGVDFPSASDAYNAYCMFAHSRGFSVRIQYEKGKGGDKTLIRYMHYCCNKEGYRKTSYINPLNSKPGHSKYVGESGRSQIKNTDETRTGCLAMIRFKYSDDSKMYAAIEYRDEHNHVLHDSSMRHLLKSNRVIDVHKKMIADINDRAGLSLKSSFNIMSVLSGGE